MPAAACQHSRGVLQKDILPVPSLDARAPSPLLPILLLDRVVTMEFC
jgi:hypothetical protein